MELDLIKDLSGTSSPMMIAAAIMYFARQLKTSILKLEEAIEVIDGSLTKLNLTLTKVIVERDTDRKDIDNLRIDINQIKWSKANGKS